MKVTAADDSLGAVTLILSRQVLKLLKAIEVLGGQVAKPRRHVGFAARGR